MTKYYLKDLSLFNFRNFSEKEISFEAGINCIYGLNGVGKTNLIESIYLAGYFKSFRSQKIKELILSDQKESSVNLKFFMDDISESLRYGLDSKRIQFFFSDKKVLKKDLVGRFPMVLFIPEDLWALKTSRSSRLKFFNRIIFLSIKNYYENLAKYNFILKSRNALLKTFKPDEDLLAVYEGQLCEYGINICQMRSEFCQKLNEGMEEKFPEWFGEAEVPKWKYFSSFLNKEKEEIIKKYLEKRVSDKENGHTQMGIHRDDFQIYQQEQAVFPKLSQGQQKTLVLVIKMIEIDLVNRLHGLKPVLLLDDLTSELDPDRRKTFFKALNESFGQVILSTTERRYYQKIKNINFINLK